MSAEGRYFGAYELGPLRVEPLTPLIGAELAGVDLRAPLAADGKAAVREALGRHRVVFFRGQRLLSDEFLAFGRGLGRLQPYADPSGLSSGPNPELHAFEYAAGQRGREAFWHFDVLPTRRPARASILTARIVPEVGGDTLWCDLRAVHDSLPAGLRGRLERAVGLYDLVFERRLARFRGASEAEAMALSPEPLQELPLVRPGPCEGERVLFVNPSFLVGVVGWEPPEVRDFLAEARARIERPEFQCRFRWRPDDIAFWDNHACLHYATNNYFPERRKMERLSLAAFDDEPDGGPDDDRASRPPARQVPGGLS